MLHYYWVHFIKCSIPLNNLYLNLSKVWQFFILPGEISASLYWMPPQSDTQTLTGRQSCLEIIAGDDITHHQHKLKRRQLASGRRRRPWLNDKLALTQVVPSKAVRSGIMNIYSSSQMSIDCVMGTQFRGIMTGLRMERLRRSASFIPEMKINK